jgi:hypothetical protein
MGSIFSDIVPCSSLKANRRYGEKVTPSFMMVSCLSYFSTLKIEETCASEMSDDSQRNTQHYIPEE